MSKKTEKTHVTPVFSKIRANPHTIIGFFPSIEDFLDGIEQPLPEISHMEERYDQKTGKRVDDVKIVDREEQIGYVFGGKEYTEDDVQQLFEDIGELIGATVETVDNAFTGDIYGVAIVPKGVTEEAGMYSFTTVKNAKVQCVILERKMRDLKLNPGYAGIHSTLCVF